MPSTGEMHIRFLLAAVISPTCTVYVLTPDASKDPFLCELVTEGSYKYYKITRKNTDFPTSSNYIYIFFEVVNDNTVSSPCKTHFYYIDFSDTMLL